MPTARLSDRTLIVIDGPEAEHFLQNIITTDLDALKQGEAKPGALLTPQGKILFDFLVSRNADGGLVLDCRAEIADDLVRRLTMYKLRAKVGITKQEQSLVSVRWDDELAASEIDSTWLADRRFPKTANVRRAYGGASDTDATPDDWQGLRIVHGIAESGADYGLGDAFPHDTLLDETGGVGFRKGCYVGQEVVSRMQHRGTARRRVMIARGDGDLPAAGAEVKANDRTIGTLGSSFGRDGLAIMRIDRVKDALDAGHSITADDVRLELSIPGWATYTLPQDADPAEQA